MRVRATFTHPHPAAGQPTPAQLVISLHGEDDPASTDQSHAKVAIIPVVDRSGSMAVDNKLGVVTRALAHLSGYLTSRDRLALVTFDHHTDIPVSVRAADHDGVGAFTAALADLTPRGSTNLHQALTTAIAAAGRTSADTATRIIVLTDGRANKGPASMTELQQVLDTRAPHVTCSFLGVGTDCDHALLGQLAAAGGGTYGFIESADASADVLGAEIGGLLDAEAHRLQVHVRPRARHLRLDASGPLALPWTSFGEASDGQLAEVTVTVGQLLRGVTRHVVIPVTLTGPKRPHARPVTCADVEIHGQVDGHDIDVQLLPKVHFLAEAGPIDDTLTEVVDLAVVADAVAGARQRASAGDLAGAAHLVSGVSVSSGAALGLLRSAAGSYADAVTYNASTAQLSSTIAAVTGSLSGSSTSFDALAARTLGGYRSAGQRRTAAATAQAVTAPQAVARPETVTLQTLGRRGSAGRQDETSEAAK
jgi:Mg-chelatase subunit ChlD